MVAASQALRWQTEALSVTCPWPMTEVTGWLVMASHECGWYMLECYSLRPAWLDPGVAKLSRVDWFVGWWFGNAAKLWLFCLVSVSYLLMGTRFCCVQYAVRVCS